MMKKIRYSLLVISALAATSVSAAPVQVGEAAASVSAGSSSVTSVSTVSSAVGIALAGNLSVLHKT